MRPLNWSERCAAGLLPRAKLVMYPKVEPAGPWVTLGLLRSSTWLATLNASMRNWNSLSRKMWKLRERLAFTLVTPGPRNSLRRVLPRVGETMHEGFEQLT